MFFKKKKPSNTPNPMPNNSANEQHRSKTPSSPFSLSGWASMSRSSLAETIDSRSTGTTTADKGKRPVYEDFGGFLPIPAQTPYTTSVHPLQSPISPRNFGPRLADISDCMELELTYFTARVQRRDRPIQLQKHPPLSSSFQLRSGTQSTHT